MRERSVCLLAHTSWQWVVGEVYLSENSHQLTSQYNTGLILALLCF